MPSRRQKQRTLNVVILFLAVLAMCFSSIAFAQDSVSGSAQGSEKGFKFGKLRLHPGLSLSTTFNSNVSNASAKYSDSNYLDRYGTPPANVTRNATYSPAEKNFDQLISIVPAFKLNYPGNKVAFTFDGSFSYTHYFGIDNEDTKELSTMNGSARASLTLFPNAVAGFTISDTFSRTSSPQQVGLATTYDRMHNTAEGRLQVLPGGGQLRFFLGYKNDMEFYEDSANSNQNWMDHTVTFDWDLEFYPKTSVYMKNSFTYRSYFDYKYDATTEPYVTSASKNPESMPLRIMAGVMGRITSKWLLNFGVGYGNSFSKNYESWNSALAKAEVTWQPTKRTSLGVGYDRSFQVVTSFSHQTDDKPYLKFRQWFANDKLKFNLYTAFSIISFGPVDDGLDFDMNPNQTVKPTTDDRRDYMLTMNASMRYDFLSWLYLQLGYNLSYRMSDYVMELVDSSKGAQQQFNQNGFFISTSYFDYIKHEALLTLSFSY